LIRPRVLFLLTAVDRDDDDARARRRAVLPAHRARLRSMIERREMVLGGSLVDNRGERAGSVAILNFPDRAAAEAWVANHPYNTEGVWSSFALHEFSATQSSIDWLPPETPRF
jgi:uncharacterized protein YciI